MSDTGNTRDRLLAEVLRLGAIRAELIREASRTQIILVDTRLRLAQDYVSAAITLVNTELGRCVAEEASDAEA